jgi:glycosyltransferase involved in cell wall biosynthesis
MPAERALLTIGHSYVVTENRRLAHEMAVQGRGRWRVTAVAPERYRGDLGPIHARRESGEASDLRTVPVRLDRFPHFMRYAGLARAMEGQWDLVHAWEEPYVAAGAQIAAAVPAGSRFVVSTFQNLDKQYPWPLSAFERSTMARANGWIPFGRLVQSVLEQRPAYAGKPSRIIPPGVDLDAFKPDAAAGAAVRADLGWTDSVPVVGFMGRFEPQKGIDTLCDALDRARAPWQALFVGGGTLEPRLREFERRHAPRVRVVKGVAHADVPRWLNAMTMLCAPSLTTPRWREQFGRMLIEAMACGVPVAGSDSGEIPFVIGDAGTIVAEGDVAKWTAAIEGLLGDAAARARSSAAGLDRARTHFGWPSVARAHLAWFEELLG